MQDWVAILYSPRTDPCIHWSGGVSIDVSSTPMRTVSAERLVGLMGLTAVASVAYWKPLNTGFCGVDMAEPCSRFFYPISAALMANSTDKIRQRP
jgi:hypothetical protein